MKERELLKVDNPNISQKKCKKFVLASELKEMGYPPEVLEQATDYFSKGEKSLNICRKSGLKRKSGKCQFVVCGAVIAIILGVVYYFFGKN